MESRGWLSANRPKAKKAFPSSPGPSLAFAPVAAASGYLTQATPQVRGATGQYAGPSARLPGRLSQSNLARIAPMNRALAGELLGERLQRQAALRTVMSSARFGFAAAARFSPYVSAALLGWALYDAYRRSRAGQSLPGMSFVPEAVPNCSAVGDFQGGFVFAGCGATGDLAYPFVFFGWSSAGGSWWWQNHADLGDAGTPGWPPDTFHVAQVVGEWSVPKSGDYAVSAPPDPDVLPASAYDVGSVADVDPLLQPILQFAPAVSPLPWRLQAQRVPNPFRSPQESTSRAYEPDVAAEPGSPGGSVPADVWMAGPGRPARRFTGRHAFRPPARNTRERKVTMTLSRSGAAAKIIGFATEWADWIGALWWALDPAVRRRVVRENDGFVTLQAKAVAIFEHWDAVDVRQALKNLVVNEIEDTAIGRLSRAVGRSRREHSRRYGPAFERGLTIGPAL